MPLTANFVANHVGFAGRYNILVAEPPGLTHGLATGVNHNLALLSLHFNFSPFPNMPATVVCNVTNAAVGTSRPCYFLPYLPNGATTMTLAGGADYFFTSMMTGCSVRVYGPAATPTVTHSNAANIFNTTGGGLAAATLAAQTQINLQLPPQPLGVHATMATRMDMEADYAGPGNFATARANYPLQAGYRMKEFNPVQLTSHGTTRPQLGMVVYGIRDIVGNWEFFRCSNVDVSGRQKTGHTYLGINFGAQNMQIQDGISLGNATRFWP
ncbi:MAG: hypothetical protein PHY54_04970 [Methylococcales bacterium]|nr:hypothetical protein [Methylococcales bacterium]